MNCKFSASFVIRAWFTRGSGMVEGEDEMCRGNGRIGPFLMNAMLATGGYPWTVIPVEKRTSYMSALESASVDQEIAPFAKFLGKLVEAGLKGAPSAKRPTS